jgi:adenylate cyclase
MKRLFLIIVISSSGICMKAQSIQDSLFSVWNDPTKTDTSRLNAISDFCSEFVFIDPDSAMYFAQLQYDFADIRGLKEYRAEALNIFGRASIKKGELGESILYYQQSHDLYEEIGGEKEMAAALYSIGEVYWTSGDYPISIYYRQQSMKIAKTIGDRKRVARCLTGIAYAYFQQSQYAPAMKLVHQSLLISEEIQDDYGIAWCINALGVFYSRQGDEEKALTFFIRGLKLNEEKDDRASMAYSLRNIGSTYAKMGEKEKALEYFEKCLEIDEEINNKRSLGSTMSAIGNIYQEQGRFELALEYFIQSLALSQEIGNRDMECQELKGLGSLHIEMGNYNLGIMECQKSYDIAIEIGSIANQLDACECLYEGNKALGKFAESLTFLEAKAILDDSLNVEALAESLDQMEFQNRMLADSLQQEEEKLKVELAHHQEVSEKEKFRNIFLVGGLFLLLLAIGLYSRNRYIRKSKNRIEKEKDRSENLLLNILPADIAAELKEKGRADARDFDLVSILFTDFKDFTEQSAKLSAADLVNELNHCFEAFDGIMGKYHIEKIKTIGDAYMAAGGLHVPTDDSVKNTVLAAIEMQAFVGKRKAEMDKMGLPAFEMRVGIHTGPVVAGIVGVKKFQYDIWGDTVNTASRMESSGDVSKVNISQATYDLIKGDSNFNFESRGKIQAKGKGEMEMWFVSVKNE